jgi:hypothetical protein
VRRDVRLGKISPEAARRDYGALPPADENLEGAGVRE